MQTIQINIIENTPDRVKYRVDYGNGLVVGHITTKDLSIEKLSFIVAQYRLENSIYFRGEVGELEKLVMDRVSSYETPFNPKKVEEALRSILLRTEIKQENETNQT